jgi:hypothetical protein
MFRAVPVVALAALSSFAVPAPAAAQDRLPMSAETIPAGNLEVTAHPTYLFGRDNAPNRYFTRAGLDADLWLLRGPVDMSVGLGAHKALVRDADNSTALDLTWLATAPITRNLAFSGGATVSFESLDGVPNSGFTRAYPGPGLRYRLSSRLDLVAQGGIGVTHESPSYFTVGFTAYLPASESARRRE